MAVFGKASRKTLLRALALCLTVLPGASYEYVANCVPGNIVKSLGATNGKIGLYVMALQTLMPTLYGNLLLMAEGKGGQCGRAANMINVNKIKPDDILTKFTNMSQVGLVQSLNKAVSNKSYLYVFNNKAYRQYSAIADCVPGSIVGGLSQTSGRIALYAMALKTILPLLFGDLLYVGQGNNSACTNMMNKINEGNRSVVNISQQDHGASYGMVQVGVAQGLNIASNSKSYIYVFKNKMWNKTWQIMLPNLQNYSHSISV